MEIKNVLIETLIPYAKNPRKNENAIDVVATSIKEYGMKQPIVVDKNNVIVVGHTRFEACKKLGFKEVPVLIASDLNDAQVKGYRIMDNKSNEMAEWDNSLLKIEIEELKADNFNLDFTGFDSLEIKDLLEDGNGSGSYTEKIIAPKYEPKDVKPELSELIDKRKTEELIKKIESSNVSQEIKDFLKDAAQRHSVFHYKKIADFYAHSDKKVQELMESSALVIIDFKKAVEEGFVEFIHSTFEAEKDLEEGEDER